MRKKLFNSKWWMPVLVPGLIFFGGCSHKLAPEGHYQDGPVTVDGNADDWRLPLRFSNAAAALQYNVTNDDKNIYVCVLSRDAATQLRMLRSGMALWFDPKGEKNKEIGLYFPIRKQPDPEQRRSRGGYPGGSGSYSDAGGGRPVGSDLATRKAELLLQSNYYNTTGFLEIENGQFGVTDTKSPILVAIKNDDQDSLLVYEVMVPIRNVLGADWKARAAKKNFSVGIVLNGTPGMGGGGNAGPRPSFGGMRGMGGMRGGMGGGRYGGGGGGSASQGQKEEASWYAFRLAMK
jgi:hypothetical protein